MDWRQERRLRRGANGAIFALTRGMGIVNVIRRLRDEFSALSGLRLTQTQVERLCAADESTVASALCALVSAGFLKMLPDGRFGRSDIWIDARPRQTRSRREPLEQRILEHEMP